MARLLPPPAGGLPAYSRAITRCAAHQDIAFASTSTGDPRGSNFFLKLRELTRE